MMVDGPTTGNAMTFDLPTSPEHGYRAMRINLFSCKRPHMRAFHCATAGFFVAFFVWFSLSPLLSVVASDLNLTRQQIWISTMCNDAATVLTRLFIFGPLCDVVGARRLLAAVLVLVSLPTALVGAVNSFGGLCTIRFAIGMAGSAFVMAQYWTGQMFVRDCIGTANAIVAGWGNLGGGVAQVVMGAGLYPLFQTFATSEQAWRSIFIFPALLALITGLIIVRVADDAPQGYYKQMKKEGTMDPRPVSMVRMADSKNAWLLAVAYACSFGIEITFNNAGSLYFQDEFGMTVEGAAGVSSVFGLTNLFARAVGGILSDRMNHNMGMQGRLVLATMTSFLLGAVGIAFAYCDTLASAIPVLVLFASLVNATEGAIFGIVPYVNPANAGSMAGIVGMGGNFGGILFAIGFYYLSYRNAFILMGAAGLASSMVYSVVHIPGHSQLFSRKGAFIEDDTRAAAEIDSGAMPPNNETIGPPEDLGAVQLTELENSGTPTSVANELAVAPGALPAIDEESPE